MIVCFPTYARRLQGSTRWRVTVAGMVARPLPQSSRRRTVAMAVLRRLLDLEPGDADGEIFQSRASAFLFERVIGCPVRLQIGGRDYEAGLTDRLGHFEASLDLSQDAVADLTSDCRGDASTVGPWINYRADVGERLHGSSPASHVIRADDEEHAPPEPHDTGFGETGRVQCIGSEGVSVISDIDDTIKLTNVGDRRELLANTFLRAFQPVPGMVEVYRRWQTTGTAFHYVSASPWQLAGCLAGFFEDFGLPTGSMHLALFRLKDSTPLRRLPSKKRSKRRAIERILDDFPRRRFVLVGDSGEKDPEIYASIARRRPRRVAAIAIRELGNKTGERRLERRLARVSRLLPEGLLQTFREPCELDSLMADAVV